MQLQLLGTFGCHLCEDAEVMVTTYCETTNLSVEYIDIAEQTQWQADYAIRIPVLRDAASQHELGWPFTLADVNNFITGLPKQ